MLDDGSRLDAKYITANLTEADEGIAPLADADLLGGVAASEYALNASIELNYALKSWVLDATHPIGSYYWSKDPTDPSILFGGTWEQIQNKFILAAGSDYAVDSTGGEATHTLKTSEMPSHKHNPVYFSTGTTRVGLSGGTEGADYNYYKLSYTNTSGYLGTSFTTAETGGGQAHNNMPPYLVAYCWCRIA